MAKLLFAGDLLIPKLSRTIVHDSLRSFIKEHDIASVNLEAPLAGTATARKKIGVALVQGPSAKEALFDAGFTFINGANNHSADYGIAGIEATIDGLAPLPVTGIGSTYEAAYRPHVVAIDGVRFGFLSLAEWGFGCADSSNTGGYAWINTPGTAARIQALKNTVDVVIIQAHAGAEEIDVPLPEWRTRYRELIDAGADVIVGHHPHIPQGYEEHNGGLIIYSLGNFLFLKTQQTCPVTGTVLSLTYNKTKRTAFEIIPVRTSDSGLVEQYSDKQSTEYLASLQNKLVINYESYIDELVLHLWKTRYQHFFERSLGGFHTLRGFLRTLRDGLLGRNPDYHMLSHNLNIETHRFVAAAAAKLLSS